MITGVEALQPTSVANYRFVRIYKRACVSGGAQEKQYFIGFEREGIKKDAEIVSSGSFKREPIQADEKVPK